LYDAAPRRRRGLVTEATENTEDTEWMREDEERFICKRCDLIVSSILLFLCVLRVLRG
jgi:hypothetical protein